MARKREAPGREETGRQGEHIGGALGPNYSTAHRRLPPYGRAVVEARRAGDLRRYVGTSSDGRCPTIWLLAGTDAWDLAARWYRDRLVLVVADDDPAARDWRCAAGADPVLLVRCGHVDEAQLERTLAAVMRDGARRVLDLESGARYVAEGEAV